MNETLKQRGEDEWGVAGNEVVRRFWNGDKEDPWGVNNDDPDSGGTPRTTCELAFEKYFCWLNFPRCDDFDRSLIMCRSACENYFISCGQPGDLWRCGESKYHNEQFNRPEEPQKNDETDKMDLFVREYFPGQPFRDRELDYEKGWQNSTPIDLALNEGEGWHPIVVCTPSLRDAAASVAPGWSMSYLIVTAAAGLLALTPAAAL